MATKSVTEFFKKDKPAFAAYDNLRKLPSCIDGLKISQRKLLWTAFDKANKEFVKTETFANITALHTAYIHGAGSLASVTATLVQQFPGACNYQYLVGNSGGWGCRMLPRESAARYTRIKLAEISSKLYDKTDMEILEKQWFEGQHIEPQYLMPVYPTLFLNYTEGLSTGFASKVYPRNPDSIITYIKKKLSGTERPRVDLAPWFRGFKGQVRFNEETQNYECVGIIEQNNMTSYTIKELPVGLDYTKFIEHLDKLVDDKVIVDYDDHCDPTTDEMLFDIKTTRDFTRKHEDLESLMKVFHLVKSLPENLTCISKENRAHTYGSVQELLDLFIDERLQHYTKRKDYLLGELKSKLLMLSSKYLFVKGIVDETIIVANKKKADIIAQLERIDKIHEVDGSYEYLLRMPIHSMTVETLAELKKQVQDAREEYDKIKATSINDMWLADLHELKKLL